MDEQSHFLDIISGPGDLNAWNERRDDSRFAVALRLALRLLPLTYNSRGLEQRRNLELLLHQFRTAFLAWAAVEFDSLAIGKGARAALRELDLIRGGLEEKEPTFADAASFVVSHTVQSIVASLPMRSSGYVDFGEGAISYILERATRARGERQFWNAVGADLSWVEQHRASAGKRRRFAQIDARLWIPEMRDNSRSRNNFPDWVRQHWESLKRSNEVKLSAFKFWIDWYESLLSGKSMGLFGQMVPKDHRAIARLLMEGDDLFWRRPPVLINGDILKWIEGASDTKKSIDLPTIPETRPAAIEPLWHEGKLRLPIAPLSSDLDEQSLLSVLDALREDMGELAADVRLVQNIDHRPADYLHRLAERLPKEIPSQTLLFRLGHAHEVLSDLAQTTDVEWPDLLAARYRRLVLQYERAVRQFPKWRLFVRNASAERLTAEQVTEAQKIIETTITELQTDDAREFIDPAIPDALLAAQVPIVDWRSAVQTGNEQLAEDMLESVNNVFKRTVELALALKSAGFDPFVNWAGTTTKNSLEELGKESSKSIVKEFGKIGKAAGPALGRFLRRASKVTIFGAAGGGGSVLLFHRLFTTFPDTFGWIEPVLRFLKLI